MNLYDSLANRVGDIPTGVLQQIVDIDLPVMTQIINMSINNNCYPDDLKLAEVSPVFNKKNDLNKELSILSTGFRKNHNTKHYLMSILERWKKTLDKGGYICATFMDLSKVFDTQNHKLLISKLGSYGFDGKQRISVNRNFSSWQDIIAGVPQGSILGPGLFDIFVNDLFLFLSSSDLSNYADDNTL